jgi:O-antigen/teichoic acid export membrane protein
MFSTTLVWQIASWGLTLLTARVLSPKDYGVLALSEAIFPYFLVLATLKLEVYLTQSTKIEKTEESTLELLLLFLGLGATVVTFLASSAISEFYREPAALNPLRVLSILFVLRAFQIVPEARIRRELRFREMGLLNVCLGIFRGLLQLVLAHLGFRFWSLVIGTAVAELVRVLAFRLMTDRPIKYHVDLKEWARACRFGFSASVATLAWLLSSTSDSIIVGRFYGIEFLGFYAMASFLMELPLSKINGMLSPILLPYFARLREHSGALRRSYLRLSSGILTVVAPALLGGAAVAPVMIPILLGDKWGDLVIPFQILSVVGVMRAISANSQHLLYALNRPNDVLKITGIPALVLPVLFVIGSWLDNNYFHSDVPGAGVFFVLLLIYPLVGPVYSALTISAASGISIQMFSKRLIPVIVSSIVMALTVALFVSVINKKSIMTLVAGVMLGISLYSLILRIVFHRFFLETLVILRKVLKSGQVEGAVSAL